MLNVKKDGPPTSPNWIRISPSGVCNRDIYINRPPKLIMLSKNDDDPVHFLIKVANADTGYVYTCEFDATKVFSGSKYYDAITFEHSGTDTTFSILPFDFKDKKMKDVKPLLKKLNHEISVAYKKNSAYENYWIEKRKRDERDERYMTYLELKKEFEPEKA